MSAYGYGYGQQPAPYTGKGGKGGYANDQAPQGAGRGGGYGFATPQSAQQHAPHHMQQQQQGQHQPPHMQQGQTPQQLQAHVESLKKQVIMAKNRNASIKASSDQQRAQLDAERKELDGKRGQLAQREEALKGQVAAVEAKERKAFAQQAAVNQQLMAIAKQGERLVAERDHCLAGKDNILRNERETKRVQAVKEAEQYRLKIPQPTSARTPRPYAYKPVHFALSRPLMEKERDVAECMARTPTLNLHEHFTKVRYFWQDAGYSVSVPLQTKLGITEEEGLSQKEDLPVIPSDTKHIARVILLGSDESDENAHPLHRLKLLTAALHQVAPFGNGQMKGTVREVVCYGGPWEEDVDGGDPSSEETLKRVALRNLKKYGGISLPASVPLHKFMEVELSVSGTKCVRTYFIADVSKLMDTLELKTLSKEFTVKETRKKVIEEEEEYEEEEEVPVEGAEGDEPTTKKEMVKKTRKVPKQVEEEEEVSHKEPLVVPYALPLNGVIGGRVRMNVAITLISVETRLVGHGLVEMLQARNGKRLVRTLEELNKRNAAKRERDDDPAAEITKARAMGKEPGSLVRELVTTEHMDYDLLEPLLFFDVPESADRPRTDEVHQSTLTQALLSLNIPGLTLRKLNTLLSGLGLDGTEAQTVNYKNAIKDVTMKIETKLSNLTPIDSNIFPVEA